MADASVASRLDRLGPRSRLIAGGVAGALAGLGQAPVSFPFATLLALALIFHLFTTCTTARRALWLGWAAGAGYFALTLSWIVEPFLVDLARHGWMAPFALLFSAVGFGGFWALAFALAHRLSRPGWSRTLAWIAALAGAELLRGYLWTGFPWALIGHAWIGWAPMQLAAWIGPHGLTVLMLIFAAGLAAVATLAGRAALIAALAGAFGLGDWLGAQPVPGQGADRPVVRLVQPNAAQHLKWDPGMAPQFFARALGYTAAPAMGETPDLILWPESSVPYLLHNADPALQRIAEAAAGVPVVLGLQRLDGARFYNSLIVLDAGGAVSQLYDKHHLVPFGEFIPFGEWLRPLGIQGLAASEGGGFSKGPGARVLDIGRTGLALPLICYEAIFAQDVRAAPRRPDWLMQITNDAWFGKVSGPYQHLAQARLRAVETGLPLVRAANTGVSAVINARGRIMGSLPLGEAGYLDVALPPPLPPTPYYRTGDLPLALALLAGLLATGLARRRNSG